MDKNEGNLPTVLLLAGGEISHKLPFLRPCCLCPALIPANAKPLAAYHLDYYGELGYGIKMAVDKTYVDEVERELPSTAHGYDLIATEGGRGVVDTLEELLKSMDDVEVIVNLVTTVPVELVPSYTLQVSSAQLRGTGSWSAVEVIGDGLKLYAKKSDRPPEAKVFTGVFRGRVNELLEACRASLDRSDLLSVIEALIKDCQYNTQEVEWIDAGHESNYHKCRAKLINSRSFNSLHVDQRAGTIEKRSTNKHKLELEARYYRDIPDKLKIFFPRIISPKINLQNLESYKLEYYGYPNLSEYQMYWALSEDSWWTCFESIDDVVSRMRTNTHYFSKDQYEDFHWSKTLRRIDGYLSNLSDQTLAQKLMFGGLRINGNTHAPLNIMLGHAEKAIKAAYDEDVFSVVHGDLCFNNILYDSGSGIIRLIDPRGSFGDENEGVFGDPRYDLAKLMHSACGHYDYIVNGIYHLDANPNDFKLSFAERDNARWLEEAIYWVLDNQKVDKSLIEIMCALLFLSMVPLHSDDERRQLALFLNGVSLLEGALTQ